LERMRSLFYPRCVAVIGASDSPGKIGYNILYSLIYGGFKGKIYPVNPRIKTVLGMRVYSSVNEIPDRIDLALIGVNKNAAVEAIEQCGRLGTKGVICIAGGFRETGDEGLALEKKLVEVTKKYDIKLVGPNTLGIINTEASLDATFYPLRLNTGGVSIIAQSGGIGLQIIKKLTDEGLGFNKWIAVGNRSVLEIADYLEYLSDDAGTKVIGIFLEGVDDARRLVQVASEVARRKPVVVYKVGQSDVVNYAAITHTGSMAGSHRLFRDIFNQFGILLVESVPELVAACKALLLCPPAAGGRVGMYTYTAGPSITALDRLAERKIDIPEFRAETVFKIKSLLGENPLAVLKNPLDSAGVGNLAETYGKLAMTVLEDPNVDILATFCCVHKNWRNPTPELVDAARKIRKPILACYISTLQESEEDRKILQSAGIPLYNSPEEVAWGVAALAYYAAREGACGEGRFDY